jgi:hypothetical protein
MSWEKEYGVQGAGIAKEVDMPVGVDRAKEMALQASP